MGDNTGIAWTDATANIAVGCSIHSPGCVNCYAARLAATRLKQTERYKGLAVMRNGMTPTWTGEVRINHDAIDTVIRWKKPRKVFFTAQGDPFHEGYTNEDIALFFAVMSTAKQHTFQVLTKRSTRMRQWFEWIASQGVPPSEVMSAAVKRSGSELLVKNNHSASLSWPLSNVWLGVTVENQELADTRIDDLLHCPAKCRFLSLEPLLERVVLPEEALMRHFVSCPSDNEDPEKNNCIGCTGDPRDYDGTESSCEAEWSPSIDWVIVGGESGPRARQFDVAWAYAIIEQCKKTGIACFVKQLGARPIGEPRAKPPRNWTTSSDIARRGEWVLNDSHGGDPNEWPEDLRVQQFPFEGKGK